MAWKFIVEKREVPGSAGWRAEKRRRCEIL
jgi:hypothetical protein